jgi:NhaA family Na+:H+ antiporter
MKTAVAAPHHAQHSGARSSWLRHFVFEYLLVLPLGALLALVWVIADPMSYYGFTLRAQFLVNDVAMVFFFGLMTKEIVEATAAGGIFHPWHRLGLPVAAAGGAIAASLAVYGVMFRVLDAPMLAVGWPVVFAMDLAFGYFVTRIIFGRHPAVTFLLLMAIVSNGLGFIALALFYPTREAHGVYGTILMAAALGSAAVLRARRTKVFWPYVAIGGPLSWLALYSWGLHPVFALVPIVVFLPHLARDPGFFVDADPHARDALDRFETWVRLPAQVALFLFGVVNGGVTIRAVEEGQWALPAALIVGRPVGVVAVVLLVGALGVHVPRRLGWREFLVIGLVSGIGFTLALFFAGSIFPAGQLLSETKMGALLSLAAAPLALGAARLLGVGRFGP